MERGAGYLEIQIVRWLQGWHSAGQKYLQMTVGCRCFVLCVASQPNNNDTLPKSGQSRFGECVVVGIPWRKNGV